MNVVLISKSYDDLVNIISDLRMCDIYSNTDSTNLPHVRF